MSKMSQYVQQQQERNDRLNPAHAAPHHGLQTDPDYIKWSEARDKEDRRDYQDNEVCF